MTELPDKTDRKLGLVIDLDTCVGCHSPHTLELQAEACAECHGDGEFQDIRMISSASDYDGDGDVEEGVYYETVGLQEMLYGAMQAYGSQVTGTPVGYESASYPYFFIDTNGDGEIDDVLLRARILLMSDRSLEAAQILAAHTDKPAAGTMLVSGFLLPLSLGIDLVERFQPPTDPRAPDAGYGDPPPQ